MSIPHISTTLSDLADEIGHGPAVLLSGAYGGLQLYIPDDMHPAHKIAKLFESGGVGFGAAMALSELYGGQTISVPEMTVYEELRKMSMALYMEKQGCTLKEISESLKVSQATVKKKLATAKEVGLTARKIRAKKRLKGTAIQHLSNNLNPQQTSLEL